MCQWGLRADEVPTTNLDVRLWHPKRVLGSAALGAVLLNRP